MQYDSIFFNKNVECNLILFLFSKLIYTFIKIFNNTLKIAKKR